MTEVQHDVLPTETQMRDAIKARDHRFDLVFVYGVITTGVFCLPSCAARPARPENLRFFYSIDAALATGLRACKRCQPLSAETQTNQLIELARYIEHNAAEALPLKALAERCKMSSSQLQKKFVAFFGFSPKAYQDAQRLRTFKSELSDNQSITHAMHSAGYGSTSRLYGRATGNLGMTPKAYRAGGNGEDIHYASRVTALGPLMLAATNRGVCFAQFGDNSKALLQSLKNEFPQANVAPSKAQNSKALDHWLIALDDHLGHQGQRPDLPLDIRGTAFQLKVWKYLLSVPDGCVVSYGEVANAINQPKAFRAAASACGANRIAVLIPCHRVLRGDGSLGGYRWGVERKRTLLDNERKRTEKGT